MPVNVEAVSYAVDSEETQAAYAIDLANRLQEGHEVIGTVVLEQASAGDGRVLTTRILVTYLTEDDLDLYDEDDDDEDDDEDEDDEDSEEESVSEKED